MNAPIIRNWCIGFPPWAMNYKLPMGLLNSCLRGERVKTEKQREGITVIIPNMVYLDTSCRIMKTNDRIYSLGDPDPKWVDWLKKMKISLNEYDFNCL